jgi:hypothetical protein
VAILTALHELRSTAFITGACRVSQLHLVGSPGSILRTGHCQITAIEIRELPERVQTQRFQAITAASDHTATCVNAIVLAPPGMHCDLTSIKTCTPVSQPNVSSSCEHGEPASLAVELRPCCVNRLPCSRLSLVLQSPPTVPLPPSAPLLQPASNTRSSCILALATSLGRCLRAVVNRRSDLSRSLGAVFGGEEAWVAVKGIACARSSLRHERDLGSRSINPSCKLVCQ